MTIVLAVPLLISFTLWSCGGDDTLIKFGAAAYSVRAERVGGLATDREFAFYDGEEGSRVTCSVTGSGERKLLNLTLSAGSGAMRYGIEVVNASFDRNTGAVAATSCLFRVLEGANTFEGRCGSVSMPDATTPCMLRGVRETLDAGNNPQIEGEFLCNGIPNRAVPTDQRRVTARDAEGGASVPARFRVVFCDGLSRLLPE
jgi:hypothetical protein